MNFYNYVVVMHRGTAVVVVVASFVAAAAAGAAAVPGALSDVACAKSNIVGSAFRRCIDTPPVDTKCGIVSDEGRRDE